MLLLPLLLASIIPIAAAAAAISLPRSLLFLHPTTQRQRTAMGQTSSSSSSSSLEKSLENNSISVTTDDGRREEYIAPTSPIKPIVHYIFLVHGWMGNSLEQDYLAGALYRQVDDQHNKNDDDILIQQNSHDVDTTMPNPKRVRIGSSEKNDGSSINNNPRRDGEMTTCPSTNNNNNIVVYSPKCNEGRTHDGIKLGGIRLANEIVDFIQKDVQERRHVILNEDDESTPMNQQQQQQQQNNKDDVVVNVTYSMVGNSLGGLYARYAISLLPYQLPLIKDNVTNQQTSVCLHPNIFCTTATPHLGVSQHTFLPVPRILETIIGTGMRTTGRDLFRLNSQRSLNSNKGLTRVKSDGNDSSADGAKTTTTTTTTTNNNNDDNTDEEMQCIIRNMCIQEKYLSPLRNFRRRIAYANAYQTDFQVPTSTAAFLSSKSGVAHHVVAFRSKIDGDTNHREEDGSESSTIMCKDGEGEGGEGGGDVPPFIVAVCETKKEESPIITEAKSLDNDLHIMSQSLDMLGWTKVFIDVRDGLPVSGITPPTWLRSLSSGSTLDNLIRERRKLQFRSLSNDDNSERSNDGGNVETKMAAECILTSQELAQSTCVSDSINIPLGHSVMVANSKTERYAQFNKAGQPVMEKLAKDLIHDILSFE
jgi:hypothetical protein